jgi:hypothetical protein
MSLPNSGLEAHAADLRSAIAADLTPARPLLPPGRRALLLAPLAFGAAIAIPLLNFFRPDLAELGVARSWGLSIAESWCGLAIVALGLRESIPGRAVSARALALTFAGGLLLPFVLLGLTGEGFSIGAGSGWRSVGRCFQAASLASLPAILASAALVRRALPTRPVVAGALYGLGCGLIADAGLRLFCDFTAPTHFIAAHGGAVVAAMGAGALVGRLIRRP